MQKIVTVCTLTLAAGLAATGPNPRGSPTSDSRTEGRQWSARDLLQVADRRLKGARGF
jgi:hypothetical protein